MPVAGSVRVAAGALALAGGVACGGGGERQATLPRTIAPPATATPVLPASPTPDPIVDGMATTITAVEAGSDVGVLERVRLSDVPCSHVDWPQPRCAAGESEGERVPRLPFVGCEPSFLSAEELRAVVRQVLVGRGPQFVGAVRAVGPGANVPFPLAPYGIVFRTAPPRSVTIESGVLAILDGEGFIISIRTGCRATPEELLRSIPGAVPIPNPLVSP